MESEMEVDPTEAAVTDTDESCLQTKSLSEESPDIELSSPMKSSPEIIPSSQIASSQDDLSNQKSSLQEVPSDEITSAQAVPSDQTSSSHDVPDQAISVQDVPSDQAISVQDVPSDQATSKSVCSDHGDPTFKVPPPQKMSSPEAPSSEATPVATSLPGPSSEAVPSKITNGPATKKQRLDYHTMSTGVYLDSTVVPILHLALVTLDRLRPADPVQYVIDFLLRHKAQYSKAKEQPAPNSSANQV